MGVGFGWHVFKMFHVHGWIVNIECKYEEKIDVIIPDYLYFGILCDACFDFHTNLIYMLHVFDLNSQEMTSFVVSRHHEMYCIYKALASVPPHHVNWVHCMPCQIYTLKSAFLCCFEGFSCCRLFLKRSINIEVLLLNNSDFRIFSLRGENDEKLLTLIWLKDYMIFVF